MTAPSRIGRYELLERIGQGSLGALYRAHDTVLGREVAVKVMAAGFQGDEAAQARFFREARAAARLQHVNIVTMFEFGEQDQTPYIVMEFLRGASLSDRLRRRPALTLHEKLDVAIQLCAGLEGAHKQGVVHRDVKPANVWICSDGTVKLLDFGIATATASNATIVDVLASPGYMSPEQIAGTAVDARTDIFSAGVVVYETLTGRQPFEADSPTGVMLKIINEPAAPMTESELPAPLKAAVARAIEKSPAARYERASDFARDLKAVKSNLPGPRDTATVMIDRSALGLPPKPQPGPRPRPSPSPGPDPVSRPAPTPAPTAPSDHSTPGLRTFNARSPLLIAAAIALVIASAGIGWCAYGGSSDPQTAPAQTDVR